MSDQPTVLPLHVKNLTGQPFGCLTVVSFAFLRKHKAFWTCHCQCGNKCVVLSSGNIQRGKISCGSCVKGLPREVYDEQIKQHIIDNCKITESGCWEWQKRKHSFGYGVLQYQGKAHTLAVLTYRLFVGPTNGLFVLHKCDNPPCCNPDHLFLGTQADNMKDRSKKNRQCKGEKNGRAKLTKEQVNDIRTEYAAGFTTQTKLAIKHNVTQALIGRIIRYLHWKD